RPGRIPAKILWFSATLQRARYGASDMSRCIISAWRILAPSVRLSLSGSLAAFIFVASARDGSGQSLVSNVGGVYVDPQGMLHETASLSDDRLSKLRETGAAEAESSRQVSPASPMRKVSLRRLEQEVARLHDAGQPLPAEIRYLAGLTSVKYVFFYPDAPDAVLAGPAEGWEALDTGDVVARGCRRPVLQLDDLVVALRYAFTQHPAGSFLGCSIEPTE